ncbi:LOW QUALITY PROTEIN: hypothetical protein KUTeg_021004 [Tegillarca granosa]|uniref:Solute carrier family 28 member 3 n=1 Tax=Tegillarca granosa TaxID=220873 RepID=A0ABQ9E9M6_TEGGR|nr:LOW QUALITY PROTEIN: hypothetical protein KUTeg_021004 [Tegillarca granosa]
MYWHERIASFNEYQLLYNDTMTVENDLFLPQWNKTLTDGILQDKTEVIATFALCGFSCIQVIGISLGAIGALAPTRKLDLINMAVRAFLTSTTASLLTACVAVKDRSLCTLKFGLLLNFTKYPNDTKLVTVDIKNKNLIEFMRRISYMDFDIQKRLAIFIGLFPGPQHLISGLSLTQMNNSTRKDKCYLALVNPLSKYLKGLKIQILLCATFVCYSGLTKLMENKVETQSALEKDDFTNDDKEEEISNLTFQFKPDTQVIGKQRRIISTMKCRINGLIEKHQSRIKVVVAVACLLLYLAYVGYSFSYSFGDEGSWRLFIGTAFGLLILYVTMAIAFGIYLGVNVLWTHPGNLISLFGIAVLIFLLFLFSTNKSKIQWHVVFWGMALQFLFGIFTTFGKDVITYLSIRFLELNKHAENGAAFVFNDKYYKDFRFLFVILFAFWFLVLIWVLFKLDQAKVMPKVLFFCTILSALNYFGVMQFIIKTIGGFLSICLGSAPVESIAAAANIFLGTTETAVFVKDYLADMPLSELFCVLTTGMSSVAGVSLLVYNGYGTFLQARLSKVGIISNLYLVPAEYLLAANTISAPAALAVAKISLPGTEKNEKPTKVDLGKISKARNLLDAVTQGCETGTRLVVVIVVNVLVYISLLALVDSTLEWFGDRAGVANLSLTLICSYILWPVAYIMGVASQDCHTVASLLGIRAVTHPGIAYIEFSKYFQNKASLNEYQLLYNDTMTVGNNLFLPQWNKTLTDGILKITFRFKSRNGGKIIYNYRQGITTLYTKICRKSFFMVNPFYSQEKTEVITTYALCGSSCFQVVGIGIGAIGALAPTRKMDLINVGFRALFTSTVANLLTACVAAYCLPFTRLQGNGNDLFVNGYKILKILCHVIR